jgi:hypothetical protein
VRRCVSSEAVPPRSTWLPLLLLPLLSSDGDKNRYSGFRLLQTPSLAQLQVFWGVQCIPVPALPACLSHPLDLGLSLLACSALSARVPSTTFNPATQVHPIAQSSCTQRPGPVFGPVECCWSATHPLSGPWSTTPSTQPSSVLAQGYYAISVTVSACVRRHTRAHTPLPTDQSV